MTIKFNVIAAVCEGGGIGVNGTLPWKLKSEMAYFTKMTSTIPPGTTGKKNVVVMGRKTWDSIPLKFRPLANRVNVVISSTMNAVEGENNKDVLVFQSLTSALSALEMNPYNEFCGDVWIIGGSSLYTSCLELPGCHRLYVTHVLNKYDCDTFFPKIPERFTSVKVDGVPEEKQVENGVEYEYKVYEALSTST